MNRAFAEGLRLRLARAVCDLPQPSAWARIAREQKGLIDKTRQAYDKAIRVAPKTTPFELPAVPRTSCAHRSRRTSVSRLASDSVWPSTAHGMRRAAGGRSTRWPTRCRFSPESGQRWRTTPPWALLTSWWCFRIQHLRSSVGSGSSRHPSPRCKSLDGGRSIASASASRRGKAARSRVPPTCRSPPTGPRHVGAGCAANVLLSPLYEVATSGPW